MRTNEIVIEKVKAWMQEHDKSHQWLADQLHVSKSLIGHMLAGNRTLLPKRIVELANLMGVSVEQLTQSTSSEEKRCSVQLRGAVSNRRSKQALEELLFAVEDYIGLKK
ncbi:helix-turn-helix transcriptional regulator [Paenibacillus campi]|uniref:helix-turn-helix domain-containing protein n=1 Tax=Paenibacillus campi TaxID=3106031 RepID=UPI002AFF5A30|nr:helix-turn-helix transcriptional regulator [Paenibacillus sp. SGZ-1014]